MVLKDSIELLKEEEEASLLPLTSHPFSAATNDDSYILSAESTQTSKSRQRKKL